MKRTRDLLLLGAVLALVAYAGFYYCCTASSRALLHQPAPELAWLKSKFDLNETEFVRVSQLHEAYKPRCAEMCRKIDGINQSVQALLNETNTITPEIEQKLADAAKVRLECQTMMLRHFVEVSRNMPPEQGRRYLEWVRQQIFTPSHRMAEMRGEPDPATHSHHHH